MEQHEKFLQLVQGQIEKPEVGIDDGRWAVQIGRAAQISVENFGKPISFGPNAELILNPHPEPIPKSALYMSDRRLT